MDETAFAAPHEAPSEADLAFERLYRSSRDDVYAYAAAILRDRAASEEVTATAFERAYRRRSRFDARRGEPRAWLFGIARNAALDELRRRSRQARLEHEPHWQGPAASDGVEDSERRLALAAALEALDGAERELIALKYFAGLANREIGRVLGISESNAGTRLHRVVAKLREGFDGAP